jgi:hypothetical protein
MTKFNMMTTSEKINLGATIGGPIIITAMIGWAAWSVNAKLDLRQATQDKAIEARFVAEHQYSADTFVKKDWFVQNNNETNEHLKSLDEKMSQVQIGIANISGQMKK